MSTKSRSELERIRGVDWTPLRGVLPVAEEGVGKVLAGASAERVVDRLLRDHRGLNASGRRVLVEAVYGVAVWRRRLFHHVTSGEPRELLLSLLRDLAELSDPQARELTQWEEELPARVSAPESVAVRFSLPDWLCAELQREVGPQLPELATALNLPGPVCLRVNRLKTTAAALQEQLGLEGVLTRPGRYGRDCLVVESERPNILALDSYRAGLFEVQDEGSQLLGELLEAVPGDSVLDLCAGAGGKTLQLASRLQNRGELHAFDIDSHKLGRLRDRAARAGVERLSIHSQLPAELSVDRVLVDAPCSELGALRRGPDRRFHLQPASFASFPGVQRELIEVALRHLRPQGRLVYATCTWRREENEDLARSVEAAHPRLRRLVPGEGWLSGELVRNGYFHSYPHRHGTDGFFAAVYQYVP